MWWIDVVAGSRHFETCSARNIPIDFRLINQRKKKIVEQECQGLVEFVAPKHDFSHVGGADGLKARTVASGGRHQKGRRSQVPMGMLFVGPMGTGRHTSQKHLLERVD